MTKHAKVQMLEKKQMKAEVAAFQVGDTVRVSTKIKEGNKERIQMFTGTVIARKGSGISETFSLHRVAYGEGMERVFLLHSPRIDAIEVIKEGKVRRAKLYYLRGTQGKAAKVKGRVSPRSAKVKAEKKSTVAVETQNNIENKTPSKIQTNQGDEVQDKQPEGSAVS